MNVKSIPDGHRSVTPYLVVKDARVALEFYRRAFDAAEVYRIEVPGGPIAYAEIQIGDSRIMLGDESPALARGQCPSRSSLDRWTHASGLRPPRPSSGVWTRASVRCRPRSSPDV